MRPNSELEYLHLLEKVLTQGDYREGRNGGVYSLFGAQMRFDLRQGFPLLTTKKVHFRSIVAELLWFLRGDTNVKYLHDHGVTIWDEWADENGELGPVYGAQWRSWDPGSDKHDIDQIYEVCQSLINDPYGRRHIVTAWNPGEIPNMALPPCHMMFQFHVSNGRLNCQLYQRSADMFLGVPFNIASYALLTHIIAQEVGLEVGDFVHTLGDYHLYANHVEQAKEQLSREIRILPLLELPQKSMADMEVDDIIVHQYNPHPTIKAPVSK